MGAERAPDEPDDHAPGGAASRGGGTPLEPLGGVERVARVVEQPGTGVGQHGTAGRAHEQLQPEFVFEPPYAAAHLRLRAAQPQRRPTEVKFLGHGHERAQLLEIHAPSV